MIYFPPSSLRDNEPEEFHKEFNMSFFSRCPNCKVDLIEGNAGFTSIVLYKYCPECMKEEDELKTYFYQKMHEPQDDTENNEKVKLYRHLIEEDCRSIELAISDIAGRPPPWYHRVLGNKFTLEFYSGTFDMELTVTNTSIFYALGQFSFVDGEYSISYEKDPMCGSTFIKFKLINSKKFPSMLGDEQVVKLC